MDTLVCMDAVTMSDVRAWVCVCMFVLVSMGVNVCLMFVNAYLYSYVCLHAIAFFRVLK